MTLENQFDDSDLTLVPVDRALQRDDETVSTMIASLEYQVELKPKEPLGRLVIEFGLTELFMEKISAVYAIGIINGRLICYKGDLETYRTEGQDVTLLIHDPSARGILPNIKALTPGNFSNPDEDDEQRTIVDTHWYDYGHD